MKINSFEYQSEIHLLGLYFKQFIISHSVGA